MNFYELQEYVATRTGNGYAITGVASDVLKNIKRAINTAIGRVDNYGNGLWGWLRTEVTLRTVSGDINVYVPHYVKYIKSAHQTDPSVRPIYLKRKEYLQRTYTDIEENAGTGAPQYMYHNGMVTTAFYSTGTVTIDGTSLTFSDAPSASKGSFAGMSFRATTSGDMYEILSHTAGSTSATLTQTFYNRSDGTDDYTGTFEVNGKGCYLYGLIPVVTSTYDEDVYIECYRTMEKLYTNYDIPRMPPVLHNALGEIAIKEYHKMSEQVDTFKALKIDEDIDKIIKNQIMNRSTMDLGSSEIEIRRDASRMRGIGR